MTDALVSINQGRVVTMIIRRLLLNTIALTVLSMAWFVVTDPSINADPCCTYSNDCLSGRVCCYPTGGETGCSADYGSYCRDLCCNPPCCYPNGYGCFLSSDCCSGYCNQ